MFLCSVKGFHRYSKDTQAVLKFHHSQDLFKVRARRSQSPLPSCRAIHTNHRSYQLDRCLVYQSLLRVLSRNELSRSFKYHSSSKEDNSIPKQLGQCCLEYLLRQQHLQRLSNPLTSTATNLGKSNKSQRFFLYRFC